MVRGLDYYMRTTFEIVHGALGAQNSVLGGGRYDGLAEALGSQSAGAGNRILDRRRSAGDERGAGASRRLPGKAVTCILRRMGAAAERLAAKLARGAAGGGLRGGTGSGWQAEDDRSRWPTRWDARFALIVGDNEIAAGAIYFERHAVGRTGADRRR